MTAPILLAALFAYPLYRSTIAAVSLHRSGDLWRAETWGL